MRDRELGGAEAFDIGSERVRRLCAEYIAAREQGHVSPGPFLERAGDERQALAAMIATLQDLTPCEPITLGRFRLLGKIDGGGQSSVFLAHDPDLRRQVAVKLLRDTHFDRVEREWVLNEARSVADLVHPGLVRVLDVGHDEGRAFLVMEHLAGPSLRRVLRGLRGESPPGERARAVLERLGPVAGRLELLIWLAEALAHCHERGVLHRDVKPENILFDHEGNARFIDFGLAHTGVEGQEQLLITQRLIGTPGYIAPEQIDHARTGSDPRSDQFAFGVLCYEVLTLERPFQGETATQVNHRVTTTVPRRPRSLNPALPASLERVVLHALEKDPGQRYPTLAAMAADLRAVRDLRPVSVEAPGPVQRARLWVRRNRKALAVGVASTVLPIVLWASVSLARDARERRALFDALGELPLDGKNPGELTAAVNRANGLVILANDLQRSWTSIVSRDIARDAGNRRLSLARRCAEAYEQAIADSHAIGVRFQSDDWTTLAQLLHSFAPDVAEGMSHRRLVLPPLGPDEVFQLCEQILDDRAGEGVDAPQCYFGHREYRRIPLVDRPVAGVYRLLALGPGGRLLRETEFRIGEDDIGPIEVVLHDPDAVLLATSRAIPTSEILLRDFAREPRSPGPLEVEVPVQVEAFHLTDLVTRAQVARFVEETGILLRDLSQEVMDGLPVAPRGPDGPAWLSFADAETFAKRSGGRLPMACELAAAHEAHAAPIRRADDRGQGEWVSDLAFNASPKQVGLFRYDSATDYLEGSPGRVLLTAVDGMPAVEGTARGRVGEGLATRWVGTCFRVAFSDP